LATRRRLDAELVRRGLVPSREAASEAVAAGSVLVAGSVATKPSRLVAPGEPVVLTGPGRLFASRGGEKLDPVLDRLGIQVAGRRCLDAGASTGGFTDVLLKRDAAAVVCVDVGYGLLDLRLRDDPRVTVLDRTNVRTLDPALAGDPVDLVVADLSFISLVTVLESLAAVARPGADLLPMVKPQFEVCRERLGAGGVVRDPEHRVQAVLDVARAATSLGWGTAGVVASPLPGPAGNVEFFLWLRRDAGPPQEDQVRRAVEEGPQ
jgi:23S rRNA (cytidine1920-2'-O)/16S rRNA (cytidine1409-2'-O)-methyltransferase